VSITGTGLATLFVVAVVPLLPTEPILAALGVLAATGHHSPIPLIIVAAVGCSVSDHVLYGVSRFAGGRSFLDWMSRGPSSAAAIDWLAGNINHWGSPTLIGARFLPAGGTVGAVLAGALRWRLLWFTPTSLTGSLLWSGYVVTLGYLGGSVAGDPVVGILLSLGIAALLSGTTRLVLRRIGRRRAAAESAESVGGPTT